MPAAVIAAAHPVHVATANTFQVTLDIQSGTSDLTLAIFDATDYYHDVSEYLPGGYSNSGGAGADETFSITLSAGDYVLVVFKVDYTAWSTADVTYYNIILATSGIAETPDNNIIPGTPLTVSKPNTTQLTLNWGYACDHAPGLSRYAIYSGTIAALRTGSYDHTPLSCNTGLGTNATIATPASSVYLLIVENNNTTNEGGYGFNSAGANRPASGSPCFTQNRVPCP